MSTFSNERVFDPKSNPPLESVHTSTLNRFTPSNELLGVGFLILLCVMLIQHQNAQLTSLPANSTTVTFSTKTQPSHSAKPPLSAAALKNYLIEHKLNSLVRLSTSSGHPLTLRLRSEAFFSEGDSRLSRAGFKTLTHLKPLAPQSIHL